jgi:hypothetical protein
MFRTCLPAGRYKENKKILLILLILSKNIPPQAAKSTGYCWCKKGSVALR